MEASLVDEVKSFCSSGKNKGLVKASFVGKKSDGAIVDIEGFELLLRNEGGTMSFSAVEEDDTEVLQDWIAHMLQFCCARRRRVEDVMEEALKNWKKLVKEDDDDNDDDDDDEKSGGGGGGSGSGEEEYEKWVNEEPVKKPKKTAADHIDAKQFVFPQIAKPAATQRLIADFAALKATDTRKTAGFEASPLDNNLYRWRVKLYPPEDSALYKDLCSLKKGDTERCIHMEMLFPCEYPQEPPFIRVLAPRFALRSGHVTIGGSVCMDILTNSGWSPVNSIESVLIQIRTAMVEGNGRLDLSNTREYTVAEAKEAFIRVATQHGWKVPDMNNLPWND